MESHSIYEFNLNSIQFNSMQITTPSLLILWLGITTMSQFIHNCKQQHEFLIMFYNFVPKEVDDEK